MTRIKRHFGACRTVQPIVEDIEKSMPHEMMPREKQEQEQEQEQTPMLNHVGGISVESIEGIDTKENDVWVALATRFGIACLSVFLWVMEFVFAFLFWVSFFLSRRMSHYKCSLCGRLSCTSKASSSVQFSWVNANLRCLRDWMCWEDD